MTNIWLGTKDLLNVDVIIMFVCVRGEMAYKRVI